MELASEHKLLPDWAAIIGGSLILVATAYTYSVTHSWDVRAVLWLPRPEKVIVVGPWVGIVVLTLVLFLFFAKREANRLGITLDSAPTQRARLAMGPSILACGVITLRLLYDRYVGFIPGIWIMLYGIALFNAGLFSTKATQVLGLAFMFTGIASILFLPEYDLALTALSFGVFNIVFGVHVLLSKRK